VRVLSKGHQRKDRKEEDGGDGWKREREML
jgi:hypothetical protein